MISPKLIICTVLFLLPQWIWGQGLLRVFFPQASFETYMQTPFRVKLTKASNNGMQNPNPKDGSNWTSCRVGQGQLVGTFRDISACAASLHLGRPVTKEELSNFSYEQAAAVLEGLWEDIWAPTIPHQATANICMHVKVHYGNMRPVERALNSLGANCKVDGVWRKWELRWLQHLSYANSGATYMAIRAELSKSKNFRRYVRRYFKPIEGPKTEEEQLLALGKKCLFFYMDHFCRLPSKKNPPRPWSSYP